MRIVIFFGPPKFPAKFPRGELWLQFTVYSPSRCSCSHPRNSPLCSVVTVPRERRPLRAVIAVPCPNPPPLSLCLRSPENASTLWLRFRLIWNLV